MINKTLFGITLIFFLASCSGVDTLDGKSYLSWVKNPKNGLRIQKELSGIIYSAQFKPYEFIVLNEEKEHSLPKDILNKRKKELDGMIYYNFRISSNQSSDVLNFGLSEKSDYINRLNYLSYDFQNNIQLVTDKDSVNCGLYHFVQGHGIVPYVDMVLGFPIDDQNTDQTLVIDDKVFGNGIIKFFIAKEDVIKTPQLETV